MAQAYPISPETVTRVTLANGLVVVAKDNPHNPSVALRGRVRGGALSDGDDTSGLARFACAALQRGTATRTFQSLGAELERRGMAFSVSAGMENIAFAGRALREDFDHLLEVAADQLLHPTFPPAEIEKLRHQLVSGFQTTDQDTRHVAYREFRARCYPESHPYHRLPEGRASALQQIPLDALSLFHTRHFRPELTTIVVVGDVRPYDAISKIERVLGQWEKAGKPSAYSIPDASQPAQRIRHATEVSGKTQADIMLGFVGPRRTDPEFYALSLADLILGRLGLRGRLGATVRDQNGLAYYVGSSLEAGVGPGPWTIFGGVNPENLERALEGMLGELRRLCAEPVTEDEVDEAREYMSGSLALRLETNDGIAGALNDIETFDLGYDFLYRYADILAALTTQDLLAAVQRYADVECYVLSVAGPAAA